MSGLLKVLAVLSLIARIGLPLVNIYLRRLNERLEKQCQELEAELKQDETQRLQKILEAYQRGYKKGQENERKKNTPGTT